MLAISHLTFSPLRFTCLSSGETFCIFHSPHLNAGISGSWRVADFNWCRRSIRSFQNSMGIWLLYFPELFFLYNVILICVTVGSDGHSEITLLKIKKNHEVSSSDFRNRCRCLMVPCIFFFWNVYFWMPWPSVHWQHLKQWCLNHPLTLNGYICYILIILLVFVVIFFFSLLDVVTGPCSFGKGTWRSTSRVAQQYWSPTFWKRRAWGLNYIVLSFFWLPCK